MFGCPVTAPEIFGVAGGVLLGATVLLALQLAVVAPVPLPRHLQLYVPSVAEESVQEILPALQRPLEGAAEYDPPLAAPQEPLTTGETTQLEPFHVDPLAQENSHFLAVLLAAYCQARFAESPVSSPVYLLPPDGILPVQA